MSLDPESLKAWDTGVRWVSALILPLIFWIGRLFGKTRDDVVKIRKELNQEKARIDHLETLLENVPDREALHELSLDLERHTGKLETLSERLAGIDRLVEKMDVVITRQEEYLLHKGAKG